MRLSPVRAVSWAAFSCLLPLLPPAALLKPPHELRDATGMNGGHEQPPGEGDNLAR